LERVILIEQRLPLHPDTDALLDFFGGHVWPSGEHHRPRVLLRLQKTGNHQRFE
jgi:hypothetical protein